MGDSLFGILGIPERVETTGPRGDLSCQSQSDERANPKCTDDDHGVLKKSLELLLSNMGANEFSESNELEKAEYA